MPSYKFKLVELIDSTKSNYEEQLRNLYYVAYSFLNVHQTKMGILEFEKYAARLEKRKNETNQGPKMFKLLQNMLST